MATLNNPGEVLLNPPADGVSALTFSGDSDLLLVCSWDSTTRLYDVNRNTLCGRHVHAAPVLDACFDGDSAAFSVGLEGKLKRFDFNSQTEYVIGSHEQPIKSVLRLPDAGLLLTGSWDQTMKVWDPRVEPAHSCVATVPLNGKVYSMDAVGQRVVLATSNRQVFIFDIRNIHEGRPEQQRESSLRFQTRCIRCYPNGEGYALSSVEGRVAMEYFETTEEAQTRKYAFKCHRRQENGKDVVYPVNSISFHREHGTFATGGCDGIVNVWDGENKKRLYQYQRYPTSIAALSFNRSGSLLAVASSYTYEQGEKDHPSDTIYIRQVNDNEVRPKSRSKPQ